MLLMADMVYNKRCKKKVHQEMIDSVFQLLGDIKKGDNVKLRQLGGGIIKTPEVTKYKFFEDKLILESECTRYEFSIHYD